MAPRIVPDKTNDSQTTIKDFLTKEIIVLQGTIAAGATGNVFTIPIISTMLAQNLYAAKVDGFQGLKGTIKARVILTGSEFQQGLLLFTYFPQADLTSMANIVQAHRYNFQTMTQLPSVKLDMSREHHLEVLMPYTNPYEYYDLTTSANGWGNFYCDILFPLKVGTGASNNVPYTVYMCFCPDVELFNPTYTPSFTERSQASNSIHTSKLREYAGYTDQSGFKDGAVFDGKFVSANGTGNNWRKGDDQHQGPAKVKLSTNRGGSISDKETILLQKGPVSKAFSFISTVADALTIVPALAAVAGPVKWAANILSGVAASLGYGKPFDSGPIVRHIPDPNPNIANCDGQDFSIPLAASCENKVALLENVGGPNMDEMAFSRFLGIYTYFGTYNWVAGAAYGATMLSQALGPQKFGTSSTDTGGQVFRTAPPMGYLAYMFNLWRGGFKLKVTFIGTRYHQGSVLIAFYPGFISGTPTIAQAIFANHAVLDLSAGSVFEVEFPFVGPLRYREYNDSMGTVIMYVNTPLTFPGNVANNIDIMFDIAASEGFEFAMPSDLNPVGPYSVQSAGYLATQKSTRVIHDETVRQAPPRPKPGMPFVDQSKRTWADIPEDQMRVGITLNPKLNFDDGVHVRVNACVCAVKHRNRFTHSCCLATAVRGPKSLSCPIPYEHPCCVGAMLPMHYYIVDKKNTHKYMKGGAFVDQSASEGECAMPMKTCLGGCEPTKPEVVSAQACIGERILSLRQIMMRPAPLTIPSGSLPSTTALMIRPRSVGYTTAVAGVTIQPQMGLDPFSACHAMFLYRRGSVRYSFLNIPILSYPAYYISCAGTNLQMDVGTVYTSPQQYGQFTGTYHTNMGGQVVCPMYSQLPYELNRWAGNIPEPQDPMAQLVWLNFRASVATPALKIYRAVADDYQLGCFLGVPTFCNAFTT
jgi:hypothetical protein